MYTLLLYLMTIENMVITYQVGTKDFSKGEEMMRLALGGYEKSLGKDHEVKKKCARNLAASLLEREREIDR